MRTRVCSCIFSVFLIFPALSSGQNGIITTMAGATPVDGPPVRGFGGDDGPGISAVLALANVTNGCGDPSRFEQTVHLSVDSNGNVYFADSNNQRIRKITPQGIISTVAGSGTHPDINSRCEPTSPVGDGPQASAKFYNPADVLALPNGKLLIADQQDNRIRQVTADGVVSTIAGNGLHSIFAPGVLATSSGMDWPSAVAVDSNSVIYFAELHGYRVGKIGSDNKFATVAGTGFQGYNGDNIQANKALLNKPAGIALDKTGNVYIADQGNHRIRKVDRSGIITSIAGTGKPGFGGDGGNASDAALNTPMDVKVDSHGNVYIADMLNHRVRRIDSNGIITTVAGTGQAGRGADGIDATLSDLNSPAGLALDLNDDLYIVDWQNYLIRRVSFTLRPALVSSGVVNAASYAQTAAPGSLISIFGTNLASSTATATTSPWPTKLGDTSVQVNGSNIPVYFVSPQQINAQLPFEATPGTAAVSVTNSLGPSEAVQLAVKTARCGIFQYAGESRGVVQNQDGSLNSSGNPESRGRVIVAFLTGQGAVDPPVPTGQAAPSDTLNNSVQKFSAIIGGAPATVQFLGLTPGFIGLGQANILIPANANTGDNVALVISAGDQSSNTVTISVR